MVAMKTKSVGLILALSVLMSGLCFAADPMTGTWKLNEKKSKLPRGMARNRTVVYADAFPFQTKVTIDGVDAKGKPAHSEWTGHFDSRDYRVIGDPTTDTRSYRQVDDRTLEFWSKKGGKVINSGRIVVAPDGKTRTVTLIAINAKGKKSRSVAVYDKA